MFKNLTAAQKGLVLVLVPVLFEIILLSILAGALLGAEEQLDQIERSRRAVLMLHDFENSFQKALITITSAEPGNENRIAALDTLATLLAPGRIAVFSDKSNPELQAAIEQAESLNKSMLVYVDQLRIFLLDMPDPSSAPSPSPPIQAEPTPDAAPTAGGAKRHKKRKHHELQPPRMDSLFTQIMDYQRLYTHIIEIENQFRATEPERLNKLRYELNLKIGLGVLLSFAVSAALAALFTKDILIRLRRIANRAVGLVADAKMDETQSGRDEIAQLDRALFEAGLALEDARRRELAILDNAADVICSLDSRLRFLGTGAAVARHWSYSKDELLGKSLLTLVEPSALDQTRGAFQRIADSNESGALEIVIICKHGSVKTSQWNITWSQNDSRFFCVVHDVTELRAVQKLKEQFISIVSHDLRSPLMSAGISLENLTDPSRDAVSAPVRSELLRVTTSLNRLMELVNELLELEKLESGKLVMNFSAVSAHDVCLAAKEALANLAARASVELEFPTNDGIISGEERRLVQVVTNLLSNAIKFSPRGGLVKMEICQDNEFVEIQIIDQGPGIAPEDRALVFDRFSQSQTASSIDAKGTGLGLAIVKAIVAEHHGLVGVTSQVGVGSTFFVRLPRYNESGGKV